MNIDIIRGETKVWKLQRKDSNGDVITTAPDEMYCSIKENFDNNEYIIQKSYTDGDITYSDEWWYITLSAAETLSLTRGKYVMDVKVIVDGVATYIVHPQTITVEPNVTDEVS